MITYLLSQELCLYKGYSFDAVEKLKFKGQRKSRLTLNHLDPSTCLKLQKRKTNQPLALSTQHS